MTINGIIGDSKFLKGLGTYKEGNQVQLFLLPKKDPSTTLRTGKNNKIILSQSIDGNFFEQKSDAVKIFSTGKATIPNKLSSFRIAKDREQYLLTYKIFDRGRVSVNLANSIDLITWEKLTNIAQVNVTCQIASDYRFFNQYVLFMGGKDLRMATSSDLRKWTFYKKPLMVPSINNAHVEIGLVEKVSNSLLIIYFQKIGEEDNPFYSIYALMVDLQDPTKVIWHSQDSLWEQPQDWYNAAGFFHPFGIVTYGAKLLSFWEVDGREIWTVWHRQGRELIEGEKKYSHLILSKIKENPIIKPIVEHFWESKATFNPAAVFDKGMVHILYRAIGDHDMSMLGYATSRDGVNIDERLKDPIYVPQEPFEYTGRKNNSTPFSAYASGGGGYGGVEDPRVTKIGRRFYMTYVAYDGGNPPRVALTSIDEADFHKRDWDWLKPVLISPPNVVDKNAVIFPEKVNGKYVIMHRIYPDILIDYVDSLDFDGKTFLKGEYRIRPRMTSWDSRKIGAGAPPIKTDEGWLLIYHAIGEDDPGRYKVGAMLLDLFDPTKVIARTLKPILEPREAYENEGYKHGVAYPCGAVTIDDTLFVYYGGADTVTCVATTKLSKFLDDLLEHETGTFSQVKLT